MLELSANQRERLGDTAHYFALLRKTVKDPNGISYATFRNNLKPRYVRVWIALSMGYLCLVAFAALAIAMNNYNSFFAALTVVPIGFAMGYVLHYLAEFQHAAAHFNLSRDPQRNDLAANLFLGLLLATDIKVYRVIHMMHHKWHGTVKDPENSYVSELNAAYFLRWLSGRATIQKLIAGPKLEEGDINASAKQGAMLLKLTSLMLHGAIALAAIYFHFYVFALSWAFAVAIVFPLLCDLRVILEHRRLDADPDEDYVTSDHGAFTRMFGGSLIARTFGGAGFNKHLLHHIDPSVPFERLDEMDAFLRMTEASNLLKQRTQTYFGVAKAMWARASER
jgi:fatty acid desaturase